MGVVGVHCSCIALRPVLPIGVHGCNASAVQHQRHPPNFAGDEKISRQCLDLQRCFSLQLSLHNSSLLQAQRPSWRRKISKEASRDDQEGNEITVIFIERRKWKNKLPERSDYAHAAARDRDDLSRCQSRPRKKGFILSDGAKKGRGTRLESVFTMQLGIRWWHKNSLLVKMKVAYLDDTNLKWYWCKSDNASLCCRRAVYA